MKLWFLRTFIRCTDTREVAELPAPCATIEMLRVPLLAHFQRSVDEHLHEWKVNSLRSSTGGKAVLSKWRDQSNDRNMAGGGEQSRELGGAADILRPICW